MYSLPLFPRVGRVAGGGDAGIFVPVPAAEGRSPGGEDVGVIDYKNEIAIIAEYNSNGKKRNVGVVGLRIDPSLQTGEFAILVADNFQESGLGTKFMETLIGMGREKGLKNTDQRLASSVLNPKFVA